MLGWILFGITTVVLIYHIFKKPELPFKVHGVLFPPEYAELDKIHMGLQQVDIAREKNVALSVVLMKDTKSDSYVPIFQAMDVSNAPSTFPGPNHDEP